MKNLLVALVILIVLGVLGWFFLFKTPTTPLTTENPTTSTTTEDGTPAMTPDGTAVKIGSSAGGNDINAYHYGTGAKEVLFVGGIHGGYSPNTSLVAFDLMDYLQSNPEAVPEGVKVTVIPVMNPDGLKKVVGTTDRFEASDIPSSAETVPGRFNGDTVDLNRNFACDWQAKGVWQSREVSGGTAAFSEPETQAIKAYVAASHPTAVIVWYSSAGGVFSSNCHDGILPETTALTNLYAKASGYTAHETFDFYEITGDMVNWLAKEGVPGISVLLTNHTDAEWSKNKAGIDAVLARYAN